MTQTDDYTCRSLTNPTVPAKYKKETKRKVHIGRHVIVGTNSIIFPGVTLHEGTSVGAIILVTKSAETWSVYFGVPAKRLKSCKKDMLGLEKQYLSDELEIDC